MQADSFYDLMELICDNCRDFHTKAQDDPTGAMRLCASCAIEGAVMAALGDAHQEGVTFACEKMLSYLRGEKSRYQTAAGRRQKVRARQK
mgnify:CR=1 FL=1